MQGQSMAGVMRDRDSNFQALRRTRSVQSDWPNQESHDRTFVRERGWRFQIMLLADIAILE